MDNLSWTKDLCEYYSIDPVTADLLSTRADHRKPSLPSSPTCPAISEKTWENLFEEGDRATEEGLYNFYSAACQGAWSAFRQSKYRKDTDFTWVKQVLNDPNKHYSVVEYGSGISSATVQLHDTGQCSNFHFTIADIKDAEHFHFAKWRLNKRNANFTAVDIEPYKLPEFDKKFDMLLILDVLEHLMHPLDVIKHLHNYANEEAFIAESWPVHSPSSLGYSDLESAEQERPSVYEFLKQNYILLTKPENEIRLWQKKPQNYVAPTDPIFDSPWKAE